MGYRALKEKLKKHEKLLKRVGLCILAFILFVLAIIACVTPPESWKYHFGKPSVGKRKSGELRIHFLDVGQGDCTLIELPDGKVMLIDGGNDSSSTKKTVMRYLNKLKIDVIDYLVVTHTDADHCGSLEEVFRYKKVVNAYMPPSFDESAVEYAETYAAAVEEENCGIWDPTRDVSLSVKEGEYPYTLAFLYPYGEKATGTQYWMGNESSAVLWLDYFGTSALFCGDAPESVEEILVRDDRLGLLEARGVQLRSTEILKVAHHGSEDSSSEFFLSYLGLQTAVISCGKNNPYGHPTDKVLQRIADVGGKTYRTDEEGHLMVTATTDGTYRVSRVKK